MFALLAVIAFTLGLVFHIVGHGTASLVTDMLFAGLICVALHLAAGWPVPWARRSAP